MRAVFLDRATFSSTLDLPPPMGVSDYRVYENTSSNADILERCQDTEIILTNKVVLSAELIQRLPQLRLIQITATGTNNLDAEALATCQRLGIEVFNVAGYATCSVPEHTFMLMLSALRSLPHYHRQVTDGSWQGDGRFCLLDIPLYDLAGKTLGLIGYGTIGKRVAEIARAFGMTVLVAERQGHLPRSPHYTDFTKVLQSADVISLHCPLTEETKHLINAHTIAQMARQPLLVNTARGDVVDAQAVADAIIAGKLLGYASDVFSTEPLPDTDPLWALREHPRVVFTPHNAWGSLHAQQKLWDILCTQVSDFIQSAEVNGQ